MAFNVFISHSYYSAAGFFYWINEVQDYDEGGWNYINELHSFVDGGMVDEAFINAVSGIVNRGCHNPVSFWAVVKQYAEIHGSHN